MEEKVATVERCLACEAVVSKVDGVEGARSGYALVCEQTDVANRALTEMGCASRRSLVYHGLASEAALHGWPARST